MFMKSKDVPVGSQKIVGPWSIRAEIVSSSEESHFLTKKALESIEDLMSGEIEYYLKVSRTKGGQLQPLILVDKFTKETRPYCWKNCDLRVEATLPLLGIDTKTEQTDTEKANLNNNNTELVKISLKLQHLITNTMKDTDVKLRRKIFASI